MNAQEKEVISVSDSRPRTGKRLAMTLTIVWLACVVAGYAMPRNIQVFDFVEKWLADLRVAALTPPMPRRSDIIILTINEETLRLFPYRSPIDRDFLSEVLNYLDSAAVKAVGMDILLDQPTEPEKDKKLADVIAGMSIPVIVGLAGTREGLTDKQAAFLASYAPEAIKAQVNLVKDDSDGTVRWIYPGQETESGFSPGFASALAKEGGVTPPTDRRRLLYRKGTDGSVVPFPAFPIHLVKSLPKQWFAGKYILIGADLATEDRHRTPYATMIGNHEGSVPGVVIHALALSQILDSATPKDGGVPLEMAIIAVTSALGVLLAFVSLPLLIKLSLALTFVGGMWIAGFGVYDWGGPIVPMFIPSVTFVIAAAIGNAIASQRYRMEKELAETAVRVRSEFLAMMSHEIRTPMNGVLGVIELMKGSNLNREQDQMASIVQDSAKSLLGILNDILDFSKIEAGRVDINPEAMSLKRLLNGVVATFSSAADSKGITIDLQVDDDVPEWVKADPVRVRQILTNLVGNAIKFTEKGLVKVKCGLAEGEDGARFLLFRVEDEGIGISPRALKKLFTPFTQADESTTRRFGGTGLGLTISRQLTELMDGRIEVESEQGKGSVFSVYLPLEKAATAATDAGQDLPEIVHAPVVPS
ncbi:MAG: ATP-binding protein, partial [Rhodospirillales bacterium]|nr:ATP-binding protein [Rhodospirillales bacterium]